jgi:pyruvate/2-oxoglutarate dehydrogenase complex dihydrolipoamide dehydrogenase (E3) component
MNAEEFGIRMGELQQILVNEKMETTAKGVYAIGSVTGRKSFDGLSEEEGRVAVENALGKDKSLNTDWIPKVIYTDPEIATVGCFAQEAHHKGFRGVEGRCDIESLDYSILEGEGRGFFKIVADKSSKKIIGGQIVCTRASEFIPLILLAIKKGLTVNSLARLSCGVSTQFQGIQQAAKACLRAMSA